MAENEEPLTRRTRPSFTLELPEGWVAEEAIDCGDPSGTAVHAFSLIVGTETTPTEYADYRFDKLTQEGEGSRTVTPIRSEPAFVPGADQAIVREYVLSNESGGANWECWLVAKAADRMFMAWSQLPWETPQHERTKRLDVIFSLAVSD